MLYTKLKTPFGTETRLEIGLDDLFVDCPDCGHETPLFECGAEHASHILWDDNPHYCCDACSKKRGAICKACGQMKDGECGLYDKSYGFDCKLRKYTESLWEGKKE